MPCISDITDRAVAVRPELERFLREQSPALRSMQPTPKGPSTSRGETSQTWDDNQFHNFNDRDWKDKYWNNTPR